MERIAPVLAAALLSAVAPAGDRHPSMCYLDPAGRVSITVGHDIEVGEEPIEASRRFELELTLAAGPSGRSVAVTVDRVCAENVAHGMEQRLGTRHLPAAASRWRSPTTAGGWRPTRRPGTR